LVGALTICATAYSQTTRTWDGGGVAGTNMDTAVNWSGDTVPSGSTGDTAQWDGTVAGNLSLTYTAAGTGANLGAGNGIHLNVIEAADSPADESWRNIQAIDDLTRALIEATDQVVIAAMQGNAGAGGVFMALAADRVWAHGGVVLSASHNPFEDNGIKIFSSEGSKFPDAWEAEIEGRLNGPDTAPWPTGVDIGRLVVHEAAEADYIAHARASCPHDLRDVRIVLDCAHGATYRVAPEIFRRLGADVRVLNASPDGQNINRGVGAMHPEGLQKEVLRSRAHLGLAFDGDADRVFAIDERAEDVSGSLLTALVATAMLRREPGAKIVHNLICSWVVRECASTRM